MNNKNAHDRKRAAKIFKTHWYHVVPGILMCLALAIPANFLGRMFPVVGGPVIAIIGGILISFAFPKLANLRYDDNVPESVFTTRYLETGRP